MFNGAWYNLFEYGTTYANIGYRALQCQDDMMADDVVSRPAYGFNSSYQFNDIAIPNNSRTSFAWYLIYKTIDNCNTAIAIDGDSEEFFQAKGQALALRAFCYLHLAQHYQVTYLKDPTAPCQDVTSRHRGAKPLRRYELLGGISLLSPEYLLSFERCPFHTETPDHYALVSYLLDLSVSQSSALLPLHSADGYRSS